jgi:DNA polymerase
MGGLGSDIGSAEAVSALEWWLEAGVDALVADHPRNWLKHEAGAPTAELADVPPIESSPVPETLGLFRDWLPTASKTSQVAAANPVLPVGSEGAEVMILAEAPGREEAVAGAPIAGGAWALTQRMLAAIGFAPDQAYLANLSCFHSPGAKPDRKEIERCGEIARKHLGLAKPRRLLLFGDAPARALLGKGLAEARGHLHRVEGIRTVVTVHPRILLDRPSEKARAWKDLLLLMEDEA